MMRLIIRTTLCFAILNFKGNLAEKVIHYFNFWTKQNEIQCLENNLHFSGVNIYWGPIQNSYNKYGYRIIKKVYLAKLKELLTESSRSVKNK